MRRILLVIAYDGTNYHGWQAQNDVGAVPTIEGALLTALGQLIPGEMPAIIGASRTDSGVHAKGNVATFDTNCTIPTENFPRALNRYLPEDIRIMQAREVPSDFHPRYTPHRKTYEYHIDNARIPDPLKRLYSYSFTYPVDIDRMREAAGYLTGTHDFTSFVNPDSQVFQHGGDAVRTIYLIEIERIGRNQVIDGWSHEEDFEQTDNRENEIVIRISGSGFLYHMIRIIVGTLLDIGVGRKTPSDIPKILDAKDRTKAGPTVPAKGLCLVDLDYSV